MFNIMATDYWLFPNLIKRIRQKNFGNIDDITAPTNAYFEELHESYYLGGVKKSGKRWTKCM